MNVAVTSYRLASFWRGSTTASKKCRCYLIATVSYNNARRPFSATVGTTDSDTSSTATTTSTMSLREKLLSAALQHVPEHGWTTSAITAAVQQDYPTISLSYATTLTETDLVHGFMEIANERLRNDLRSKVLTMQQQQQQQQSEDERSPNNEDQNTFLSWSTMSRLDRIAYAIQTRLLMVQPYLVAGRWHEGMALGAQYPHVAWETSQQLKDLVHIIVQETASSNSSSIDNDQIESLSSSSSSFPLSELAEFSLGAVYVATECHMLTDTSENYQETWTFLRQQLHHWDHLRQHGPLTASSVNDVSFLASTVLTAFGHGVMSVSNIKTPPSAAAATAAAALPNLPPPLDQVVQSIWNSVVPPSGHPFASTTSTTSPPSTTTTPPAGTEEAPKASYP
jgi:hypothetical protein